MLKGGGPGVRAVATSLQLCGCTMDSFNVCGYNKCLLWFCLAGRAGEQQRFSIITPQKKNIKLEVYGHGRTLVELQEILGNRKQGCGTTDKSTFSFSAAWILLPP